MQVDITQSQVTILVEVDGEVCAVKMDKDKFDAVSFFIKQSIDELIKTGKTQTELRKFLLPSFFKE